MTLREVLHSRTVLVLGVAVSLLVPAVTLPRLPHVTLLPVLLGLIPWVIGKYVFCPLRWRALTGGGLGRVWHMRAYAESELLGLLTPGHVGADLWRMRRLTRAGLGRGDALVSVGLDRFVGAVGLTAFVVFAGTALPARMLVVALGVGALAVVATLLVRRFRPELLPARSLPRPRLLAHALVLSAAYQPPPRRCCSGPSPPPATRCRRWRPSAPSGPASSPVRCPAPMAPARATALSWSRWWRRACPGRRPSRPSR